MEIRDKWILGLVVLFIALSFVGALAHNKEATFIPAIAASCLLFELGVEKLNDP